MTQSQSQADKKASTNIPDEQRLALSFAVRHLNASTSNLITEETLLGVLQTGSTPVKHTNHIFAFIDETDTSALADLVISGATTYDQLVTLAGQFLPPSHPTRKWLNERRL